MECLREEPNVGKGRELGDLGRNKCGKWRGIGGSYVQVPPTGETAIQGPVLLLGSVPHGIHLT